MRLVSLDTTETRFCAKCHTTAPPFYRHHKGCDGFLGRYNRGIASNYQSFLYCVDLCFNCHAEIHFIYNCRLLNTWVNKTPKGALHMRGLCIRLCDRWIAGRVKIPQKHSHLFPAFVAQFESSKVAWLAKQNGK